jgi:hypothetical protein
MRGIATTSVIALRLWEVKDMVVPAWLIWRRWDKHAGEVGRPVKLNHSTIGCKLP